MGWAPGLWTLWGWALGSGGTGSSIPPGNWEKPSRTTVPGKRSAAWVAAMALGCPATSFPAATPISPGTGCDGGVEDPGFTHQ